MLPVFELVAYDGGTQELSQNGIEGVKKKKMKTCVQLSKRKNSQINNAYS